MSKIVSADGLAYYDFKTKGMGLNRPATLPEAQAAFFELNQHIEKYPPPNELLKLPLVFYCLIVHYPAQDRNFGPFSSMSHVLKFRDRYVPDMRCTLVPYAR